VKCVVTSKHWVMALEDYVGYCRCCNAIAMYPVHRALQDLQLWDPGNKR